jgi:tripartite ATP-independent transporter DctP family solute receptor
MQTVFLRRVTIAVVIMLIAPASLCLAADGRDSVSIIAASPFKSPHILVDAAEKFAALIKAESGGRISVRVIAGEASEEDVNIQCSKGTVDIQLTGGRPVEVFAPQYFFFNAPYVIKDYDHFLKVWNGELGKKAKDQVLAKGNMLSIGTVYRGLRQTTSNRPIAGPGDLGGLKLRLPVVPTWIAVWKSLGAEPVPVPLPELYDSLKSGRAEASEGDLTQIVSFKLAEVQSELSLTNHLVAIGWVTANKDFFNRLTEADQKLVMKTMEAACAWATEKMVGSENELLKQLQAAGMKVTKPDAAAIRDKAKGAVEELFKTAWPVTTWAEVLAQ